MQFKTVKYLLAFLLNLYIISCYGNAIDSLRTDKEVFAFVRKHFPEYCKGGLSFEKYYNETNNTAKRLNVQNWVKADLDGNGETDLILFRCDDLPNIFAVLSKQNKFECVCTDLFCSYNIMYPVVSKTNNQSVILLYNQNEIDSNEETKPYYTPITCDTITCKYDRFLNYLSRANYYDIEKIRVENNGICEGNCPQINVEIDTKNFKSKCSKSQYWDKRGTGQYAGELKAKQIRQIVELLEYSNFSQLKDTFSVGCTDQTTTTLTITYNNGKVKTISDYGDAGNFTLAEIYSAAYDVKWVRNNTAEASK